ncbi:MAG: ATP-binding protein [Firmicutes bacterium]|nr:ATP-binding protein [Bacillota bacterium]
MKEISRNIYLEKLINRKENGMIKVVTGIRRSGKSYLLDPIFKKHLISEGVQDNHIIKLDLEERKNKKYLDPDVLDEYIRSLIVDKKMYYVILDEIQLVNDFESVLNGFLHIKNVDVYVTGSNSKFLSTDIITEFRGRGDEIRVYPLSFAEFLESFNGSKNDAWNEYLTYGGLPYILTKKTEEEKSLYLNSLFETTYIKDIVERNNVQRVDVLNTLINILASSVGSLTNPSKLTNTFISNSIKDINAHTITTYIGYLLDSFLIKKSERYDVKGKRYIQTPQKYYFSDIGLRNARLNFRQQEENHLMENIIYNELITRGYNVDVGVVEIRDENKNRKQLEVDFVCNLGNKRYYIQSALNLDTREKTIQEERPLMNISDNFKKIIVVKDDIKHWFTEEGILVIGIQEFLLNKNSLDL